MKRKNYMAAFAYFKSFFDRLTADLDVTFNRNPRVMKPNYKAFYKESALISFYSIIDGSEAIIRMAHKLRNANPLSHSSSVLLNRESTTDDLKQSIKSLSSLSFEYIAMHL